MPAPYVLSIVFALAAPAATPTPATSPAAAPTPTPAATPSNAPSAGPSPAPSPSSSPSANPFAYIVTPSPPPAGAPRIVEIALNDRVLHAGGMLLVRVTTSTDVTAVVARTWGREIAIPRGAPGYFAGQEQLPGTSVIPSFLLNRTYPIDFVARAADGRSTTVTVPVRLEH